MTLSSSSEVTGMTGVGADVPEVVLEAVDSDEHNAQQADAATVDVNVSGSCTEPSDGRCSQRAPSVAGPQRSAHRVRDDSLQRKKASRARSGSRCERRWENRARLIPTDEDLENEMISPFGGAAETRGLFSFCFEPTARPARCLWKTLGECGPNDADVMCGNPAATEPSPGCKHRCNSELTPRERFLRIPRSTRQTLLRHGNLPAGAMQRMEGLVLDAFGENASGVLVVQEPNSFNRCLLHSICQYLGLESRSANVDGHRVTTVMNTQGSFRVPEVMLSEQLCVAE